MGTVGNHHDLPLTLLAVLDCNNNFIGYLLPEAGMKNANPTRKPTASFQTPAARSTRPDLLQVRFQLLPKLNAWSSRLILALDVPSQLGSVITHI
jgi:hypothetical protein